MYPNKPIPSLLSVFLILSKTSVNCCVPILRTIIPTRIFHLFVGRQCCWVLGKTKQVNWLSLILWNNVLMNLMLERRSAVILPITLGTMTVDASVWIKNLTYWSLKLKVSPWTISSLTCRLYSNRSAFSSYACSIQNLTEVLLNLPAPLLFERKNCFSLSKVFVSFVLDLDILILYNIILLHES